MAIIWNKLIPRWSGDTIEPPEAKKDVGYIAGDKPPAKWENWLRKGTYEALDETRGVIENIDSQLAQIEAEINTPDSASLSLTELQQIKSVTDSYASPAKLTLGGATLFNAVKNGDFSNGTTGWSATTSTLSVANKILRVISNGTSASARVTQTINISNSRFYKVRVRVTNANCILIVLRTTDNLTTKTISNPIQNQWYDILIVGTAGLNNIDIFHQYPDAATANGKVMEIDGNVGVFAIPITGTPYENYTADQMNALVNTYFEGLKSCNKMEILTRGRNLFNLDDFEAGFIINTDGRNHVDGTRRRSRSYHKIADLNLYVSRINESETVWAFFYDKNKNYLGFRAITQLQINGAMAKFTGQVYVRFAMALNGIDLIRGQNIMVNYGSTALPFEPYQGSKAKIQCTDETKFTLAKLPNNVKNEILMGDGKWRAVKRVERYVLQAADITALTTTGTNRDIVTVTKKTDGKSSGSITNAQGRIVANYTASATTPTDATTSVGLQYDISNTTFGLVVAKGAYASLSAAQTALAGTVIYYELATPITIEEEDFAFYSISINGSISSNLGYTEFVVNDYNILASTDIEYAQNLAESIAEVAKNIDGIRDNYAQINQVSNPNLLINGDFQIWQRGTSFTVVSNTHYTADRWMMLANIGTTHKVDKVTDGLKITTLTKEAYFMQRLENSKMLGKTVTASCSVDGVIYKLTATISATNSNLTTPWGVFYIEYDTTTTIPSISFKIDPNKTITINWVKLELGSIATPFHPKSYADELSSCQRYYLGGNWIFATPPYELDNTNIFFIVPTPTTVRLKPTLIQGDIRIEMQGVAQTGFTFEASEVGVNALIVRASKANHGIQPGAYVYVISTTAGYDAEIY